MARSSPEKKLARLIQSVQKKKLSMEEQFEPAVEIAKHFLDINRIDLPVFADKPLCVTDIVLRGRYYNTYPVLTDLKDSVAHVHYLPVLLVLPKNCHKRTWSKTGAKDDVTTVGVCAHELGHHVHYQVGRSWAGGLRLWNSQKYKHRPVTSYAKQNEGEALAEAMRLFILNPGLLKRLSPGSYDCFVKSFELKHASILGG